MTKGSVAPGFELVAEQFDRGYSDGNEIGSSFCAIVDNVKVVDVWGGYADISSGVEWQSDTIAGIFSGGKGLVATCVALALERDLLDLERPVADYWPEFAAGGKDDILVRHLVSHQSGLPGLEKPVSAREATDPQLMASLLAQQKPICPPGTRLFYHSLTFGWLCGELLRRVDGRSIGDFFGEEIARKLDLDLWIGLPTEQEGRVARLEGTPGFGPPKLGPEASGIDEQLAWSIYANPPRLSEPLPANARFWREAEVPASNAIGAARSLARLYACLANGGFVGGKQLLTPRTVELASATLSSGVDPFLNRELSFGVGFQLNWMAPGFGPAEFVFGHPGAGGSVHGAWPRLRTGFSYVPNMLLDGVAGDRRAGALLTGLHSCVTERFKSLGPVARQGDASHA